MRLLVTISLLAWGCGGDAHPDEDAGSGTIVDLMTSMPDAGVIPPSTECRVTTYREPATSQMHREPCSAIDYPSHPPSSGPHYSVWADFRTYDAPVPWGFLVHSMEHGAVVLAYDCPDGCPDVVATLEQIVADHGADPACGSGARFIVVPDAELDDGSIAAVAWENVYLATCLDEPSLRDFVSAHYAMGPEDLCAAGLDGSDRGWCM